MAEITFEEGLAALEAIADTAETTPTYKLNETIVINPREDFTDDPSARGTLVSRYGDILIGTKSDWTADGALDLNEFPLWLNLSVKGGITPTQPDPTNAPSVYLWTALPAITLNDLKTGTLWGFDPNITRMRAAGARCDTLSLTGDNRDIINFSASGFAHLTEEVTGVVSPAANTSILLPFYGAKAWIEPDGSTDPYGTTPVPDGLIVSWGFEIDSTWSEKYAANGTGDLSGGGRKARGANLHIELEMPDLTYYNMWKAGTHHKVRFRAEGGIIPGTTLNYYWQVDIYGRLNKDDWGSYADTNRTIQLTVPSMYENSLGADWKMYCQNSRATV